MKPCVPIRYNLDARIYKIFKEWILDGHSIYYIPAIFLVLFSSMVIEMYLISTMSAINSSGFFGIAGGFCETVSWYGIRTIDAIKWLVDVYVLLVKITGVYMVFVVVVEALILPHIDYKRNNL